METTLTHAGDATDCLNFSANSTNDHRGLGFIGRIAI